MILKRKSGSDIVVWAIDPFEGKIKPHPIEVRNLLTWITAAGVQIQPVYVLNLPVSNHTGGEQIQLTVHKTASWSAGI